MVESQFLFILKFLGEVLLVFIIGGLIGTILRLDKVEKDDSQN
jgi:hypothetical protein